MPAPYSNACKVDPKGGGISRIFFVKCTYEFTDITDQTEWDNALDSGDVVMTGLLKAGKAKGTASKKKVDSCSPERVVSWERCIQFQDYNSDDLTGDYQEYEFWNTIQDTPEAYQFGWITCDNRLYGPIDRFTIEVDEVIEDEDKGNTFFDGSICWDTMDMPVPTDVDLTFDQGSVSV